MNTLRSLIFVIWLYGGMAVIGISSLPVMLLPRRHAIRVVGFFSEYVRLGLRFICGIRVELRGQQHIPGGALLVAGKHQSMLDVFIPFILFRDPAVIMKRELLWYPALGWYALKTRMIAIDRAGTARTLKAMLRQGEACAAQNRQLMIYPEGTRTQPGAEPDYKPAGLTALYGRMGVPVLPLATNSGLCWKARGLTRRPGLIVYEALPPVEAGLDRKAMFARLQERLEAASQRLLDEGLAAQGRTRSDLAG